MADATSKVGVEFVVKGLAVLKNALAVGDKGLTKLRLAAALVKKGLEAIKPKAGLLERAFVSLGRTIKDFAQNIIQRILVIAFGVLVRDAIRKVIDVLGDMIRTVVEAANEFQALEIRLNSFNMQALVESGLNFNDAMKKSIALTKEQLSWMIQLGLQTPYDATDIANAYGMSRAFSFTDIESKKLTEAIVDFTSGMGLGNEVIDRIILNFGQMSFQGKITAHELRDLATGSLMPVNRIMEMVAKNIGVTTDELNKMQKAGKTDPQWFIDAFIEFAETNFAGAAEKMSRTLPKALGNLKELFVGVPALYTIKPIFDEIGGGIADLVNLFGKGTERFKRLQSAFSRIGLALADIVRGLLPNTKSFADTIVSSFENIAKWLQTNKGAIIDWVKNAIVFLKNMAAVIKNDVIPVISKLFKWIYDNREEIWKWVKFLGLLWLMFQVGNIILRGFIGLLIGVFTNIIKIVSGIIGLQSAATLLKIIFGFLGISIGAVLLPIFLLIAGIGLLVGTIVDIAIWAAVFIKHGEKIKAFFSSGDWEILGKNIIIGLINGIGSMATQLYNTAIGIANNIIRIFNAVFNMNSPSKVMFDAGTNITKGLAKGITTGAKAVLGVTTKLAESVSDTLSGTKTTTGAITAGITTSKTSDYLSNTGEVMRSKLDTTAGGDPCAPGTAAGCAAEKISGALGGIGSSIADSFDDINGDVEDWLAELLGMFDKGAKKSEGDIKEMKRQHGEFMTAGQRINNSIENMAKGTEGHIQDSKNRIHDVAERAMATTKENGRQHGESSRIITRETLNTMYKTGFTFTQLMQLVVNAAISKINSMGSNTTTTSLPTTTGTTNVTSTTNVVNNFGKGTSKGSQVTFDYEASKFWMA